MELLSLCLSLCLISCSTPTSAQQSEPAVSQKVTEDGDAVLLCSLASTDVTNMAFVWKKAEKYVFFYQNGGQNKNDQHDQFKGRVFHFPGQLTAGNASILLKKAELRDSGSYTCVFPPSQDIKATIELTVDPILKDRRKEKIPGAVSEPHIKHLKQTADWALLQCAVRGASPKPVLVWRDSSGNVIPASKLDENPRGEGKYDIILQATVTKSDNYTCESTQEGIFHRTSDWTQVDFSKKQPREDQSGKVSEVAVGLGVALLFAVVVIGFLIYCRCRPTDRRSSAGSPI